MEKKFGQLLRKLRDDRDLTLRQMEERAHVSNAYLSQIERGERGIPNFKVLRRLAGAYGVPVTELVLAAEKETEGHTVSSHGLTPEVGFISRGYEKLSEENRRHLTAFLQHLIHTEKKKRQRR